ncbi:heavy-metal-associated domain-containing protein [Arthrobacter sp. NPDC057388]|uniref:heavy-metal-associated domain-containing protein n=1 Tax=Arthrobacter sp. NPDC057388 TaxID=3346116 RepID=UPI00362B61BA
MSRRMPRISPHSRQPQRPLMLRRRMETGMFESENRAQLPLAVSSVGRSCCSPKSLSSPHLAGATAFTLEGLTCGHCAQTVEKAASALEGVESAAVELVPGGRSRLLIAGKPARAAVRQAVVSAGYTVVGS